MKRLLVCVCFFVFISCQSDTAPDVSNIPVQLEVKRFDQDFFNIDTTKLASSLKQLREKYPEFLQDYFHNILGLPLDSSIDENGEIAMAIKQFIHDYTPVKDSSDKIFENFDKWQKQIRQGLQYVKYYFPDYNLPNQVITFIGPFDAFFATSFGIQGDIMTHESLGVGLQLHLGKDFSFFKSEAGQELYPTYISETFTPSHIPVNCLRNVVDDLYPPAKHSLSLIEQIVNNGRKYYLLKKFMPSVKDEVILDYTSDQMKGVTKNEAVIWDFFLNNDLLNSSDQSIIKNYIGPAPKTQEFGEGSPGNIGSFSGLQIVRKYMDKYPETTLQDLMKLPPREVYERSKYKPKG